MATSCISTCINDARLPVAVRPTYVNLYKWPESDVEFVRSRSSNGRQNTLTHTHTYTRPHAHAHAHAYTHARVVDSLSCRQMYLRSYKFSRKKVRVHEKISRRVKERVKNSRKRKGKAKNSNKSCVVKRKRVVLRKAKEASCAAFLFMFRRLLSCTAKVDVADNDDHHHHLHDQGHG